MDNRYKSAEELYLDNCNLVFTYIADYSIEANTMNDIASTVWLKVWERTEFFLSMDKKGVKQYLRKMVKTAISDYFRALKRESKIMEQMKTTLKEDDPWSREQKKIFLENEYYYLRESLKILNEEERRLLILRFKEKKTAKEVGVLLNLSETTVRVRQLRMIKKMKAYIAKLMENEADSTESKGKMH